MSEGLAELSNLVNGCRDDGEGRKSKQNIVDAYLIKSNADALDTICALHIQKSITINGNALIGIISWSKGTVGGGNDPENPGLYLASTLASFDPGEMRNACEKFFVANQQNPTVDMTECLRFVNSKKFCQVDKDKLFDAAIINWSKPPRDGKVIAPWKKIWDENNPNDPEAPTGAPMYIDVRNQRGVKMRFAFLGGIDAENTALKTPQQVLCNSHWKLPNPSMCISTDAGSMHPRQCDTEKKMHHLPQFREWVDEQKSEQAGSAPTPRAAGETLDEQVDGAAAADGAGATPDHSNLHGWAKARAVVKDFGTGGLIRMSDVVRKSIQTWQDELDELDTEAELGDGSINNLIFTKLKDVFAALLDAGKLAGAWVVVDRTDGQGSATAELLLELALERGAQRPNIIAIDSLERLGKAKPGSRSHAMFKQLHDLYYSEDAASKDPNGTEAIKEINFHHNTDDYMVAEKYASIKDENLPLEVLAEHKRKSSDPAINNTCNPSRKWRYYYVDGIFASATHYIIKSNDTDEFNMESIGRSSFLYAHGDTRSYKRLRANIQQGKPIVMLHNSGGVVTAFSWLQRVMAHMRPPPDANKMRGPLRFLIGCLSSANWVHDFGTPEVMMMKTLAERAPQLFRKNVVSVDILTESEEQILEVISGCFSMAGGVPELGLGNAEVNVLFSAWEMHILLYQNSKKLWRRSILFQSVAWILLIVQTFIAVFQGEVANGIVPEWVDDSPEGEATRLAVIDALSKSTLLLPVLAALITTMTSKMLWRDKWSVCVMACSQLVSEIYKFRLGTLHYDPKQPQPTGDDDEVVPLTAKEKARMARAMFVERVKAYYSAALTEMSQGFALKKKRKKVAKNERHEARLNTESKPTLSQWYKLKKHVEKHYYKNRYALPVKGGNFLNWVSGLRPFLNQRTIREELRSTIEVLIQDKKIVLVGRPLSDSDSRKVRGGLAQRLGLPADSFDSAKDEIRMVQREIVATLWKEEQEEKAEKDGAGAPTRGGLSAKVAPMEVISGAISAGASAGAMISTALFGGDDDDEVFTEPAEAMRKVMMEMQGLKYGKLTAKQKVEEKKKAKKRGMLSKQVDDDYLVGPISIDSYVTFRVRPLTERLEKQATKLAGRLTWLDIISFTVASSGTVLAAFGQEVWISLTVALSAVIFSITEFTQLRNQVVSTNLALRELHAILVWWDSLSLVRRRTNIVTAQIVSTTEDAFIDIVDAHTTAASNTQKGIANDLDKEEEGDDEEEG